MSISDSEVRAALRRATDHLDPPPTLLDDARRGGHDRVVRRRTLLGGVAVAVGAAAVGGVTWGALGGPMDVASPLLDEPTRGDLAGDATFRAAVRRVWERRSGDSGLTGEIHLTWAGSTPAGPAAFVVQRTSHNPVAVEPEGYRLFAECAFAYTTPDGLRLTTVTQMHDGPTDGVPQAALIGPDNEFLVVVDFGADVSYSPDISVGPDGRTTRTWLQATFTDGAFVGRVGPQRGRISVALGRAPYDWRDMVHIANMSEILDLGSPRTTLVEKVLPGAERAWGPDPTKARNRDSDGEQHRAELRPYVDPCGTHLGDGGPLYDVIGAMPDGRRFWVNTIGWKGHPARHLLFLGRPGDPLRVGRAVVVQPDARSRPVTVTLPDRQGAVLMSAGARLRHRAAGGDWRGVDTDAVLLPPDTAEVEVAVPGRPPEVFPLPAS